MARRAAYAWRMPAARRTPRAWPAFVARLALRCALALAAATVAAGPAGAGSPITEPFRSVRSDTIDAIHPPSPAVAQRRSATSTLVPLAVGCALVAIDAGTAQSGELAVVGSVFAIGGLIIGPAAGYHYGGLDRRGVKGAGARLALIVGLPIVVALATEDDGSGGPPPAWTAFLAGTGLALVSAIWDVATVGGAVERHNRTLGPTTGARLVPAVAPFSHAPGFAVRVGLGSGAR